MKTARELAEQVKAAEPNLRIGYAKDSAVGYYDVGKWWPTFVLLINGKWCHIAYAVKANGEDMYKQEDWTEI